MRTLIVSIIALALLLTAVTSGSAARKLQGRALENSVELVDGSGEIVINLRGALIGTLRSGKVTVTDLPGGADTDILVLNDQTNYERDANTTVYIGENLRFRVFRGRWRVRIQGVGIEASIVGKGAFALEGTDGRYSVAGGPYRTWPEEWLRVRLGD